MARYAALQGVDETLHSLSGLSVEIRSGLREVVRKATERTLRAAISAAPSRTGALRDTGLRAKYFDDGDVGSVFVAPTRDARGTRAKNLPIWLEYGTRRAAERPFLVPAGEASAESFGAESLRVVTSAVREAE
jgi:hypothetical protein